MASRSKKSRSTVAARPNESGRKTRFSIKVALNRIREAVATFPKAALFELFALGHTTAFEQLVACIISIRTRDEVTVPTARRLFAVARSARKMAPLPLRKIDALIHSCSFHRPKAAQIREIAKLAVRDHAGKIPCDEAVLLSFRGVGPKCANLVLGIACGEPRVGVDIHVHRVVNRWGYVAASTPEATMAVLHKKLPRDFWIELNSLLVPFGKHICTGRQPKCSTCPVLKMCRQVGVTTHR